MLKFKGLMLSAVLAASVCVPLACSAQTTLQGHWSFDDVEKPALDAVSNMEDEIQGAPTLVTGKILKAMSFAGQDAVVARDNEAQLSANSAFTVECWFRLDGAIVGQRLVGKWGADAASASYILWTDGDGKPGVVIVANNQVTPIAAPDVVERNRWYHLRATWDGKDAVRLFVDNVLAAEKKGVVGINAPQANFIIGAGPVGVGYVTGLIDEVKFYRGVVTEKAGEAPATTEPKTQPATMTPTENKDATRAIPATHQDLQFSDYVHLTKIENEVRFDRLIDVDSAFRWDNPGARIRFRTDAKDLVAQLFYNARHTRLDALNGVGAYRVNGGVLQPYQSAARPGAADINIVVPEDGKTHLVEVMLPYGESVDFRGLKVNDAARFFQLAPLKRPRWVAYGDSITHGFRASDISRNYPFQIGEQNNWEVINMGFGGRQMTPADGSIVASLRPDTISVLMGANDGIAGKTPDQFRRDLEGFLDGVRATQKTVPVYLVTPLSVMEGTWNNLESRLEPFRAQMRRVVAERGDQNLKLIEGPSLIPAEAKYFQDGLHPNDEGFRLMAQNLAPQLKSKAL